MFNLRQGKCGARMSIHATIMAYHPNPSEFMLVSLMHPNFANIRRIWVANPIATQTFHTPVLNIPYREQKTIEKKYPYPTKTVA